MSSPTKKAVRLFAAIVLAGGLALGGCSSSEGAAAPEEPKETVKIAVVGPNADGEDAAYVEETSYALADVEDAWELS